MVFSIFFPLLGGLAIFLYAMKLMSESLQEASGKHLRTLLQKVTKSRFKGVLTGVTITSLVQSSSVTTVMVVGFVNAGLFSLTQAISVIMGANIGTTFTSWIVSLLGFKVKITSFAFPSILLGVILLFTNKAKLKHYGLFFVGFGLLFLGLQFMKSAIPDATKNPAAFQFLSGYVGQGFYTVILFILIGMLMTIIVQSSSATSTITIALAFSGYISVDAAFGMILGENIGTTITANLAAIAGDINSKRAALSHSIFNLIGVILALTLFEPMKNVVAFLVGTDPLQDKESARFHVSTFHSMFNVSNTLLLVWFLPQIEKTVLFITNFFTKERSSVPGKLKEKLSGAKILHTPGVPVSTGLEIAQIVGFNQIFLRKTMKNFRNINDLILKKYSEKKVKSILATETSLDAYRYRMLESIYNIQASGVMGRSGKQVMVTADIVKRLEEIGDVFARIARRLRTADKNNISIKKRNKETLKEQITALEDQIVFLTSNLKQKVSKLPKSKKLDLPASKRVKLYKKVQVIFEQMEKKSEKNKFKNKSEWLSWMLALDTSRDLNIVGSYVHDIIELQSSLV